MAAVPTHPYWFKPDPDGPHTASTGVNPGTGDYIAYCRRDGEKWPCEVERARNRQRKAARR